MKGPDSYMHDGTPIWFNNPFVTPVHIDMFETPIKNICRYNGGLEWRLVQHLALGVLLAYRTRTASLSANVARAFAAHDLQECIVGDVVSGLKKHLDKYKEIESTWEAHVHTALGIKLTTGIRNAVKTIDLRCLVIEMKMLGHPAAGIVADQYGGLPNKVEEQAFKQVASLTLDECWEIVKDSITND